MRHRILSLFLATAAFAYGAEPEFERLVRAVETHYGVKRMHIPLLGVANLFVKVAHPAGTSAFHLAIFENLPSSEDDRDPAALDGFIRKLCDQRLHVLVITHSRQSGDSTYILAGEAGKSTKVLIATFERDEATVVEVTADFDALLRMIEFPGEARQLARPVHNGQPDW